MKYLDDALLDRPCRVALCVDEKSYLRETRRLGITDPSPFVSAGSAATAHWFDHRKGGKHVAIVCVDAPALADEEPIAIAAMLVHEAVHVFQDICECWGERSPSREFEAYSIQRLSQSLMRMYCELVLGKRRGSE